MKSEKLVYLNDLWQGAPKCLNISFSAMSGNKYKGK